MTEKEKECLETIGRIAAILEMGHLTDKERLRRIKDKVIKYVTVESDKSDKEII
jgi:hypothetical protein